MVHQALHCRQQQAHDIRSTCKRAAAGVAEAVASGVGERRRSAAGAQAGAVQAVQRPPAAVLLGLVDWLGLAARGQTVRAGPAQGRQGGSPLL